MSTYVRGFLFHLKNMVPISSKKYEVAEDVGFGDQDLYRNRLQMVNVLNSNKIYQFFT